MARKSGKRCWLDKLPGFVSQTGQILEAFPQARLIELVRDGRDILVSKKKRLARGGAYDPLWDTLAWKSAVRAGDEARRRFPQQVRRVRYEDLTAAAPATIEGLCAWLGLRYTDDLLNVGWINTTSAKAKEAGIGTAAVGKWQRDLTPAELSLSQRVAAREFAANDYRLAPVGWRAQAAAPLLLARSGLEFFGRLADRWRTGGTGYARNVLGNYFARARPLSAAEPAESALSQDES
jgi:hypothetical protein